MSHLVKSGSATGPLFSLFVLFLKTSCICSWLTGKCLFYVDVEEFPVATTEKTNIAECHNVTDIKKDLHGLPSNLLKLCIQMDQGCVMVPWLQTNSHALFLWQCWG